MSLFILIPVLVFAVALSVFAFAKCGKTAEGGDDTAGTTAKTEQSVVSSADSTDAGSETEQTSAPAQTVLTESPHVHNFDGAYRSGEEGHWLECVCGEKKDPEEHSFGEWTLTKEPTELEDGEFKRSCTVCGYSAVRTIGKLSGPPSQGLNYRYIPSTDSYAVVGSGSCTDTVIYVPKTYNGKLVTEVGVDDETAPDWDKDGGDWDMIIPDGEWFDDNPFRFSADVTEIVLPDTVKEIHAFAFSQENRSESKLKKVTVPEGVESISFQAFYGTGVEDLALPSTVRKIEPLMRRDFSQYTGAFPAYTPDEFSKTTFCCGDDNLTNVTLSPDNPYFVYDRGCFIEKETGRLVSRIRGEEIPDYVTEIGDCTFCFFKINDLVIPDSVKKIGDWAFYGSSIKSLTLGKGVETVGKSAFSTSALGTVIFQDNGALKKIGPGAFCWCKSLISVTLPEGLESIGSDAFYNCGNLNSVIIPSSVSFIGEAAFRGTDIAKFDVSPQNTLIVFESGCLISKSDFRLLKACDGATIPDYVRVIDPYACYGIKGSFNIPAGVTSIGRYAFANSIGLHDVVIPDSIINLADGVFYGTSLGSVTFGSQLRSIGDHTFEKCVISGDVVLPEGFQSLGYSAFEDAEAKTITLPGSWQTTGLHALCFKKIEEIRYDGTKKQFRENITDEYGFSVSDNARVVCTDGLFDLEELRQYRTIRRAHLAG